MQRRGVSRRRLFCTSTLKVWLQSRPGDPQQASAGAGSQLLSVLFQGCGSQQMQLVARSRGRHIEQPLRLVIFPPALQFSDPRIDGTLFSIAANGSDNELLLLLLPRPDQPGLFQPAKQRLGFGAGDPSQAGYDDDVETPDPLPCGWS